MTPTKHEQRAEGRQDAPWTRDDLKDLIAEAISDSMAMGGQPSWVAESVLAALSGGKFALVDLDRLRAHAGNLERYPFESATMGEAGRLAATSLRESSYVIARDELATLAAEDTRHDAKVDAADRADALGAAE